MYKNQLNGITDNTNNVNVTNRFVHSTVPTISHYMYGHSQVYTCGEHLQIALGSYPVCMCSFHLLASLSTTFPAVCVFEIHSRIVKHSEGSFCEKNKTAYRWSVNESNILKARDIQVVPY